MNRLTEETIIKNIQSFTELAAERIKIVRPIKDKHFKELTNAINNSKEQLGKFLGWVDLENPHTLESTIDYQTSNWKLVDEGKPKHVTFIIALDDVAIGSISLDIIKIRVPYYEIGYWMSTEYAGNGYMTEAVNALTSFMQEHLCARRIEIRCNTENTASNAVAKKAGYTFELTKINDDRIRGELESTHYYAKTWND